MLQSKHVLIGLGVRQACEDAGISLEDLRDKHLAGEWGDLSEKEVDTNKKNLLLVRGAVLSRYSVGDKVIHFTTYIQDGCTYVEEPNVGLYHWRFPIPDFIRKSLGDGGHELSWN